MPSGSETTPFVFQGRHQLFWSGAAVKQGVELEYEVMMVVAS